MKSGIAVFLPALHFLAVGGLALYGAHRIWLLVSYWGLKYRSSECPCHPVPPIKDFPIVTLQLPLYNERFVALRVLDAAAMLDWPRDRLQIQVLDDSTDQTQKIVDERAAHWRQKGVTIQVIRRLNRDGYKAGALARGLACADGDLVAIFDADFIPPTDFLRRTVPCFSDPAVGMVQTRWGFLNAEKSWLTRIQSLLLSPHFGIEHLTRYRRGLFFNFNGTAGIWRKEAIVSAGGWQPDTVTEDLDLSYRAQILGWRFIYLDEVVVPSELPVTLASFRSQQQRWAKGSVQTAKKILPALFRAPLPLRVKIEGAAHLLSNFGWLFGAIIILTLFPTILSRVGIGPHQLLWRDLPLFLMGSGSILFYFFYGAMQKERNALFYLPFIPVLSIGLAPAIAFSVLKGLFSRGGVFERTPKFGLRSRDPLPRLATLYHRKGLPPYVLINIMILAYMFLPILFAWQRGTWMAIPLLIIFPLGFFLILCKDFTELIYFGGSGP